jgi:hypothetical protein
MLAARGEQFFAFKQAERPFRRNQRIIAGNLARRFGFAVTHACSLASRQARSRISPRRIQLFMVPSGTPACSASWA